MRRRASATAPLSLAPIVTVPTIPSSSTAMSVPGLLLQGVDDLALGPDHLTDLVDGDLEAHDLRGGVAHVGPGLGDGLGHDGQDLDPGLTGLLQGRGQHVGRQAVDLGVELQGGDEVGRAGHLEVHVAEGVLGAEDVGEGDVAVVDLHQAHGDPADRRLDRHAGVHQRQARGAHRRHRGRPVRGQHLGHQPQGVGELLDGGHDREQGPLGQQAVADLATLRAAHPAGLAVGVRRHVVVVHVALLLVDADGVEQLVHAGHARGW